MTKHRQFNPEFKAKVVLQVISGEKTASDICREHSLKPDLFSKWKTTFLANAVKVFEREAEADPQQERIDELERLAGKLSLELEIAKKASRLLRSSPSKSERS
jgi:transposase-like protein